MAAAAAERTNNMKFITGVTAAVYRYNPAIIAQAFASLDVLYPGRIGLDGEYFKIKNAKLYTPPSRKIPLYMAAVGEQATKTAAKHTDSLITLTKPDQSKEIFDIFDKAAIKEGKDPNSLEKIAKPKLSYSEDYDKALKSTEFWRASLLEDVFNLNISDPRELEQKAKEEVSDEKLRQSVFCWK
jgi:coenzyme F420-dependent glucose-6-phosphate dehydrogenase